MLDRLHQAPITVVDPFCGSGTLLHEFYSYTHDDYPVSQRSRLMPNYVDWYEVSHFMPVMNSFSRFKMYHQYLRKQSSPLNHNGMWKDYKDSSLYGFDIDEKCIQIAERNTSLLQANTPSPIHFKQLSFRSLSRQWSHCDETKSSKLVVLSNVRGFRH